MRACSWKGVMIGEKRDRVRVKRRAGQPHDCQATTLHSIVQKTSDVERRPLTAELVDDVQYICSSTCRANENQGVAVAHR